MTATSIYQECITLLQSARRWPAGERVPVWEDSGGRLAAVLEVQSTYRDEAHHLRGYVNLNMVLDGQPVADWLTVGMVEDELVIGPSFNGRLEYRAWIEDKLRDGELTRLPDGRIDEHL